MLLLSSLCLILFPLTHAVVRGSTGSARSSPRSVAHRELVDIVLEAKKSEEAPPPGPELGSQDSDRNVDDPMADGGTPPFNTVPPTEIVQYFETELIIVGDDVILEEGVSMEVEQAFVNAYVSLGMKPFQLTMTSAEITSIVALPDDGRRMLRNTTEILEERRRTRASASITSYGRCYGCPSAQRFTTMPNLYGRRRHLEGSLRRLQSLPTAEQFLEAFNTRLEGVEEIESASILREFNEEPESLQEEDGGTEADGGAGGTDADEGAGGAEADEGAGGAEADGAEATGGTGGAEADEGTGGAEADEETGGAEADEGTGGAEETEADGGAKGNEANGGAEGNEANGGAEATGGTGGAGANEGTEGAGAIEGNVILPVTPSNPSKTSSKTSGKTGTTSDFTSRSKSKSRM